ncbi:MAG: GvpL/GvpF family gas vesicle protein, partial [Myxococcota bacterium]
WVTFARLQQHLHDVGTLLPFQFGCLLEDRDAVAALLAERSEAFQEQLAWVEGCSELSVYLMPDGEKVSSSKQPQSGGALSKGVMGAGRAFLQRRRAFWRSVAAVGSAGDRAVEQCRAVLKGCCVASAVDPAPVGRDQGVWAVHFLVHRAEVARFREAVWDAKEVLGRFWMSGPWPPHHFVGGGEAAHDVSRVSATVGQR